MGRIELGDSMASIGLEMADEEFEVFAECFCRDMPIPQTLQEDGTFTDDYTSLEWVKMYVINQLERKAKKGYNKLVLDQNPPDTALMESMLSNL